MFVYQVCTYTRAPMPKHCSNCIRLPEHPCPSSVPVSHSFFCACLPILKYGNNSWDLSGWFPKSVFGYACGSMRKVLRKHDAQGSSRGSSWRPYVRLETLFAEASRKHLPRNHCGRVCGNKMSSSADQEELVFAEAPRKLACGRVVIFKEINKE